MNINILSESVTCYDFSNLHFVDSFIVFIDNKMNQLDENSKSRNLIRIIVKFTDMQSFNYFHSFVDFIA